MAKFIFQLETILNVREKKEETKKTEYGQALNELVNKQNQLIDLEEKLKSLNINKNKEIRTNTKVLNLQSYETYKKYLCNEKKIKKQQINEQAKHVESKRLEMLKAVTDKKAIIKLKEKQFDKFLQNENKLEQAIVDEIVSYRYMNK